MYTFSYTSGFIGVNLSNTHLSYADLTDAQLGYAKLNHAGFDSSKLYNADFRFTSDLDPQGIQMARDWELADYDKWVSEALGLLGHDGNFTPYETKLLAQRKSGNRPSELGSYPQCEAHLLETK